jgi:hypothetical protein
MTRALVPGALACLLLAGCEVPLPGAATEPGPSQTTQAIRQAFATEIGRWNAQGIDPVQILNDPVKRAFALAGCGSLTSISSVVNPGAVSMTDELGLLCLDLVRALAPAAQEPAIHAPS